MIEVSEQIEAVGRRVGTRRLAADEVRVVTISQRYRAELEDVWDACTDPDRIARWFLPVSGELRLGGRYQLAGNAGGTIETCDPPHGFTATWEFGGAVSWIQLRLSSEPDGRTRFELDHIAPLDDERWTEFGPGAVGVGWDLALVGLTLHLNSGGRTVDPAAVAAWLASPAGVRFVTLTSDTWSAASVAAGADEAAARAAAARTTAFYTGAPVPGTADPDR